METTASSHHRRHGNVRNEAVFLYDMNADDIFADRGYVVIDSSLGLIGPRAANPQVHRPEHH